MIAVRSRLGRPQQGWLAAGGRVLPCALGRGGTSARKREGDGATPLGTYRFREAFAPAGGRVRTARLPFALATARDGWCDAPGDRNYNRGVTLPYPAGHERLVRDDHLYDMVLVPDHNRASLGLEGGRGVRGLGSAVFVHLAHSGYTPTEGCIALSRRDMEWLWPRVGARTRLRIG